MGGDFNAHLDDNSKNRNVPNDSHTSQNKQNYIDKIKSVLSEFNLTDVWRSRNPTDDRGTFHRGHYSARLDYCFLSAHLSANVLSCSVNPHPLSDHCMLELELGHMESDRGPGYWRFNNTLLDETKFKSR